MKKLFYYAAIPAACCLALSSCKEDTPNISNPDFPTVTEGAYVLNQGTYSYNIEGSLNVIDFSDYTCERNVFQQVNARSLGDTPQTGIVYGSKIYLGIYGSSTIEVIASEGYKSIKQIKMDDPAVGKGPRSLVARGGKVYISLYDGHVARLDTVTLSIDKSVEVGPNPEIMALHNNKLYVPNSDGMNWQTGIYGKTASVIDLNSFTVTSTITVPENPEKFFTVGNRLFLISKGNYNDVKPGLYEIGADDKATHIVEATMAAGFGNHIYYMNLPYFGGEHFYGDYDLTKNQSSKWNIEPLDNPVGLGIDPITGTILITSTPLSGGFGDYNSPGYTNQYDAKGNFVKKYNTGAGPSCIFFKNK